MGHNRRTQTETIDLLLIGDDKDLDSTLRELLKTSGVSGTMRRIAPGTAATQCVRRSGDCRERIAPKLVFFDFSVPNEANTAVLRDIAFGKQRTRIPLVLLTTASSQHLLHAENISGDGAIMFSPTPLRSFVQKMRDEKRATFLKAVTTLYEYGPILVQLPERRAGHIGLQGNRVLLAGGQVSYA